MAAAAVDNSSVGDMCIPTFKHLEDLPGVEGCSDDLNWEVDFTMVLQWTLNHVLKQ